MGFWDRETHMSKAEWKAACAHHARLSDGAALTAIDLAQPLKRVLDAQAAIMC
jgi:hypothetical protein